ncbi:uncharacterized protein L969DRAFT_89590 [Mixia osmundae IAM 14324]|uniref:JmjC domain-containing histone demethylation protein 1 n=1 Tax=Mixia osmundae (strain CBS 9802 / IAM 14324 / JCM 22182 / KY 12970) TaxID=764103 RepID=G7EA77_MIXOS|nr:uncharacterized protein L969DRAFT_89590 [Mixia osmundae IAM 14324]KEI37635.1 hypothetical protein L969DRAFT_89590 [Mixia osmundae IAM 14324]GAA99737.1 hypothetical protein E5Q_06440 [Mixia osmundae IAM 14324]
MGVPSRQMPDRPGKVKSSPPLPPPARKTSNMGASSTKTNGSKAPAVDPKDDCGVCSVKGHKHPPVQPNQGELPWIRCDGCKQWYHWACVAPDPSETSDAIDKWYDDACIKASERDDEREPLKITYRGNLRKSSRQRTDIDYSNLNAGLESDPGRWMAIIHTKRIEPHPFPVLPDGASLTLDWLYKDPEAMKQPVIIERPDGLGMTMPESDMTVSDIARLVGPDSPVEVVDVASQADLAHWTLGKWASYYENPRRAKIRNVISLEVSHTALGKSIVPPKVVRELDWVMNVWPKDKRAHGDYPKVQKYCLMSVQKCWTDWHIDFAGSSVFYHILKGSKVFYFIRPTAENLRKYESWSGSSEAQESHWLGDEVDHVYKVELTQGNTMIIPTGWIHAVYTPSDSLVFGGNFVHGMNIETQLRVADLEIATKVPRKFRFPQFVKLLWYAAQHYHNRLSRVSDELPVDLPLRVIEGLLELSHFLLRQCVLLARSSDAAIEAKKRARESIPPELKLEPAELAESIRQTARRLLKLPEEDFDAHLPESSLRASDSPAPRSLKRKADGEQEKQPKFKNYQPEPPKINEPHPDDKTVREKPKSTVYARDEALPPSEGGHSLPANIKHTQNCTEIVKYTRMPDGGLARETRKVITTVERCTWSGDTLRLVHQEFDPADVVAIVDQVLPPGFDIPVAPANGDIQLSSFAESSYVDNESKAGVQAMDLSELLAATV